MVTFFGTRCAWLGIGNTVIICAHGKRKFSLANGIWFIVSARFLLCRTLMKLRSAFKSVGVVAVHFFAERGPTYLKIAKDICERTAQEDVPSWDRMWTEVDKGGKTLGRRILETFWAEDR
jgi:hypothetical protein